MHIKVHFRPPPLHIYLCAADIVGVVEFSIKVVIFSSIPSLSIFFFIQIIKKGSLNIHNVYLLRKCPPFVVRHLFHYLWISPRFFSVQKILCVFFPFLYPLDPSTHLCCTGFLLLEQFYFNFDLVTLVLGSNIFWVSGKGWVNVIQFTLRVFLLWIDFCLL